MSLTDEQIAAMMQKHIICKTKLVSPEELDGVIAEHSKEGWEVANKVDCNGKIKITFRKVEKVDSKS